MPDETTREEIHADVDTALDAAQERETEQNWRTSMDARLAALEGRPEIPGYDDAPLRSEIGEVKSSLDRLVDSLLAREERSKEAETTTSASVEATPPETPVALPSVNTQVNSETDFRERIPRQEHSLFRRFGRR
jgi:hypothetical protein